MGKTSEKRLIEYKQQENLAFKLWVQAHSLDGKVNMKLLMLFPLPPVPLSIGTSNSMILKTDKAKGMCYLKKISYHLKIQTRIHISNRRWECIILCS